MQLVQHQQPFQLGDWIHRVVDPKVDKSVVGPEIAAVLPHHQQRRALHPRLSPPPACPALSAAISRSASAPRVETNVSAMFFTVWSETMMLAWAEKPRPTMTTPFPPSTVARPVGAPTRPPAQSNVRVPVKLAALPRASTMPTCRSWSIVSVRMMMRSASSAVAPWAISSSPSSP